MLDFTDSEPDQKVQTNGENNTPESTGVEANVQSASMPDDNPVDTSTDSSNIAPPEILHSTLSPADKQDITATLDGLKEEMAKGIGQVLKTFEEKLAYDQFKEGQITQLHDELQSYKTDLIAKTVRPLVNGLIRLHDDIGKIVEALKKRDLNDLTPDRFFKVIEGFKQDLELLLSQNGVETYTEPENNFNPHRQKALTTVPLVDTSMVGSIAARLRPGFEQGNTILQKERVAVYVLASSESMPVENEPQNTEA